MHIEASYSSRGSAAILESPYMLPTDYCSMTFYYHMFGGDCGSLRVYVYSGQSQTVMKFNKTGDQGPNWQVGTVTIKSQYGFRVHIVATKGSSFKGDIAIDDISFSGTCKFTTETALPYGAKALTSGLFLFYCRFNVYL